MYNVDIYNIYLVQDIQYYLRLKRCRWNCYYSKCIQWFNSVLWFTEHVYKPCLECHQWKETLDFGIFFLETGIIFILDCRNFTRFLLPPKYYMPL